MPIGMPSDELLVERIRQALSRLRGLTEKRMFGSVYFMINGNMCAGVNDNLMMLSLWNDLATEALREPHTREMDFTGRPLKSMIYVEPEDYDADEDLERWVNRAAEFAKTLPKKK